MNWRYRVLGISALCLAAAIAASPARAQTRVGEAAVVKNEVVRVVGSAPCHSSNRTNAQTSSLTPDTDRIKRNLL
jgi:hypothetical protein